MQGWYLPVTNKHYATSGADGTFEIKDVPAGKHKLLVWHPIAAKKTKKKAIEIEVDVKDGATAEANFRYQINRHFVQSSKMRATRVFFASCPRFLW